MQNPSTWFVLAPFDGDDTSPAPAASQAGDVNPPPLEFHLVPARSAGRREGMEPLPLPSGPSQLMCRPHVTAADPLGTQAPLAILEPVQAKHHQLRLLIVQSSSRTLALNGLPAPKVAVAKERDFLQWGEDTAFHLSIYRRPSVGAPPPALVGKECLICRVAFQPDSKCVVCPGCHAGLHCEDDRDGGLECALLQAHPRCPSCGRDLELRAGYGHDPEVEHA